MKKFLTLFVLFTFSGILAMAQTVQITGKVTSSEDGLALPGASIVGKGTSVGVNTNIDGQYTIILPEATKTLVFSFIGMVPQEVSIDGRRTIDVVLEPSTVGMQEVVVIGYGTQQRRDVAGAVSSVKASAIEKFPVPTLDKAIQGRAAGVQVTSTSGIPGGSVSIRVRGRTSITAGTEPLYIIDGVQLDVGDNTRLATSSNSLGGLNPNDIESIEILKDAGSSSIYGAQAANGVVLITTKKGISGKTKFDFSAQYGVTDMIRNFDVMNGPQFSEITLESFRNRYGETGASYVSLRDNFIARGWVENVGGVLNYSVAPTYDWVDAVFRQGKMQEYTLSATGGDDKTQFFTSGSYNQTEGQVIGSDYSRVTFRSNITHKVNNKLSFESRIGLSHFTQTTQPAGGAYANPSRSAYLIVPTNPIYDPASPTGFTENSGMYGGYTNNVVFNASVNYVHNRNAGLIGSFAANYNILKNLTFRSAWNLDFQEIVEEQFYDPRSNDGSTVAGRIYQYNTRILNWSTDQTLNYSTVVNDIHKISAVAGFSFRNNVDEAFFGHGTGLPSPQFQLLNAVGTPQSVGSSYTNWRIAGTFARLNYTMADKYIFSFTGRYDGSSRFGINNKYGFFPAAQLAWRISSEEFMKSMTFIDDMKLKFSYGVNGNSSIGSYDAIARYGIGGTYMGGRSLTRILGNPDITWETSTTYDAGLTLSMFRGRVGFEFDYFLRDSKDLLLDRPLPRTTGFGSITQNIGSLRNTGLEFTLNTVNITSGGFEWRTDLNLTLSHIEITSLLPGEDELGDDRNIVGYQPYTRKLYVWGGINPADGRPMRIDQFGNYTYRPVDADRQWMERGPEPTFYGGLTNELSFKGVALSVFFQYSGGNSGLNSEATFLNRSANTNDRNQYLYVYEDRWTTPGQITYVAQANTGNAYLNGATSPYSTSTFHYEPLDYLRLKNISLSYTLPASITKRVDVEKLQVYFQATNLWTLTNYTGYDPEFALGDTDFGTYPQGKNYSFGIKMSF